MENTEKKTVASWRQEEKLLIVILLLFLVLLHQLFLLVWPSICRPWFKICVNSPRGPGPTCSLLPFVHKVTKDNGKRLDPALPRGSNLPSSCCVVLLYSSLLSSPLPPPFCKTLSPPISSSLFGSFHHPTPQPPTLSSDESLSLPAQAKCKRKLLCAADGKNTFKQRRSRHGTATTNRTFCEPACGDPFIMETAGRGTGGSVRFICCGVRLQEGKFRKKEGKTRLRRL